MAPHSWSRCINTTKFVEICPITSETTIFLSNLSIDTFHKTCLYKLKQQMASAKTEFQEFIVDTILIGSTVTKGNNLIMHVFKQFKVLNFLTAQKWEGAADISSKHFLCTGINDICPLPPSLSSGWDDGGYFYVDDRRERSFRRSKNKENPSSFNKEKK